MNPADLPWLQARTWWALKCLCRTRRAYTTTVDQVAAATYVSREKAQAALEALQSHGLATNDLAGGGWLATTLAIPDTDRIEALSVRLRACGNSEEADAVTRELEALKARAYQ